MTDSSILKEITKTFVDNVWTKNLLKSEEVYGRFSRLFNSQSIPTPEQLRQALFKDEELP